MSDNYYHKVRIGDKIMSQDKIDRWETKIKESEAEKVRLNEEFVAKKQEAAAKAAADAKAFEQKEAATIKDYEKTLVDKQGATARALKVFNTAKAETLSAKNAFKVASAIYKDKVSELKKADPNANTSAIDAKEGALAKEKERVLNEKQVTEAKAAEALKVVQSEEKTAANAVKTAQKTLASERKAAAKAGKAAQKSLDKELKVALKEKDKDIKNCKKGIKAEWKTSVANQKAAVEATKT